jgi:hypothetical protein
LSPWEMKTTTLSPSLLPLSTTADVVFNPPLWPSHSTQVTNYRTAEFVSLSRRRSTNFSERTSKEIH